MGMCGLAGQMKHKEVILYEPVKIGESSNEGKSASYKAVGENGEVRRFKSKNLLTERNRRQRLSERMLVLRSLVPKITNMNKATIIVDAVSYIEELQGCVEELTNQLQEMEVKVCSDDDEERDFQEGDTCLMQEIIQTPIQAEVDLTVINHSKLWMKLVFTNRRGGFTQLMEALNYLGLEPTDVSLTTSGGAALVSLCLEGIYGQDLEVNKIRELLQDIISNI